MKYRIRYHYDRKYEGYYGEYYSEDKKYWYIITDCCLTKWGCKRAIKKHHEKRKEPLLLDEFQLY